MGRVSDTREKLLASALRLVWQRGYAAVTIEEICDAAGVRKGSFYHFFPTKEAVVTAALEEDFASFRAELDRIFSCTTAPLARLTHFFQHITRQQMALHKTTGQLLGCPIGSISCEVIPQEKKLSTCIQTIFATYEHYLATAIRDAIAAGDLPKQNIARQARLLTALFEGILAQARIHNDPGLLKSLLPAVMNLLGAPQKVKRRKVVKPE